MTATTSTYFQLQGKRISFMQIYRRYVASKYGKKLKENVRFLPYKPKNVTNAEWEALLGPDVNNLKHLWFTYLLTRDFLRTNASLAVNDQGKYPSLVMLTPFEQQVLLFTAVVHDWAEAIIGDIPYPIKTDTDTEREMVELRKLIHEILGDENSVAAWDEVADHVENILIDTDSKLGRVFNLVERLGYVGVALRAWTRSKKKTGELKNKLEYLGMRIVPDHLPMLLQYAESYPSIDYQVKKHRRIISEIITVTAKTPSM